MQNVIPTSASFNLSQASWSKPAWCVLRNCSPLSTQLGKQAALHQTCIMPVCQIQQILHGIIYVACFICVAHLHALERRRKAQLWTTGRLSTLQPK